MSQIELILACLALGVVLRWSGRLPADAPKTLGGWVINVALPAAALLDVHAVRVDRSWLLAAASPWIGVALAIAVLVPLSRWLGWSRSRLGALLLVAGWGNTSFVGLPMIQAYYGQEWVPLGLVIDLFGSYLALSVVGISIATVCGSGHIDVRTIAHRIVTFPPFLAIVIALATNHLARPPWLDGIFSALAATMAPIALAAVGYAIDVRGLREQAAPLAVGLGFRLVVAPLVVALLYLALGQLDGEVGRITVFEMAMPPMLGASVIAMERDLEPDLVGLLIGIGIPLSMLTAPLWWAWLR